MSRPIIALFATLLIAVGAQSAYAQPGRGMDPEQQIKELIAQLDVTQEQEPAFRAAMVEVNELRMGGMGRGGRNSGRGQGRDAPNDSADGATSDDTASNSPEERREMMEQRRAQIQEQTKVLLAPVLSSAQLEKFNELEAAGSGQRMRR